MPKSDLILFALAAKNVARHIAGINYAAINLSLRTSTIPDAINEYTLLVKDALRTRAVSATDSSEIEEDYATEYAQTAQNLFYQNGGDLKFNVDAVAGEETSIQAQFDAIHRESQEKEIDQLHLEKIFLRTKTANLPAQRLSTNADEKLDHKSVPIHPARIESPIESVLPVELTKASQPLVSIQHVTPKKVLTPSKVPVTRAGRLFQYGSKQFFYNLHKKVSHWDSVLVRFPKQQNVLPEERNLVILMQNV